MKKLFFFLVFIPTLFAQKVIGDTTDLKSYDGSGVVVLEQYGGSTWDLTGGGLFHYIDSTYDEGTHAFDHPVSGMQWARLGAFGTMTATTLSATTSITTPLGTIDEVSLDSLISVGQDIFTTTAETDTVTISGATADDAYIITGLFTVAIDQQDILQGEALAGKLVVHRMAAGESALKYIWIRFKTH